MRSSACRLRIGSRDGARPADIPIERPVRFDLVIDMKTAKALGVSIPQSVLLAGGRGDPVTRPAELNK